MTGSSPFLNMAIHCHTTESVWVRAVLLFYMDISYYTTQNGQIKISWENLGSDKETWFLADLSSFHAIPIYSQRKCKLKWSTINPRKDISALGPADTSDIQWTTNIKHLVSQYSLDAITMNQSNNLDEAFNLQGFKNHKIPVTKLRDLQLRTPAEEVLPNGERKFTLSQDITALICAVC